MADSVLPKMPLTVKDIVHRYKGILTAKSIYKAIAEGRLKAKHKAGESRTWYIRPEDFADYLENGMWEGEG